MSIFGKRGQHIVTPDSIACMWAISVSVFAQCTRHFQGHVTFQSDTYQLRFSFSNCRKFLSYMIVHLTVLTSWSILLIRDMVVKRCYRWFGCETIHPTQKFTSMNLLPMPCMGMIIFDVPRLWRLLKAKIISGHTLWHFNSTFASSQSASSAYQRFTKKSDQLWLSASIQPPYLEF